jgi:VWFA-related protein
MRFTRLDFATLGCAAIFVCLASAASGQDGVESNLPGAGFDAPGAPATGSAAPTIKVYSRETIVDVLVTDDRGQPVTGLKQSDFTVTEDGRPQPIRSFSEYSRSTLPQAAPVLPPNTWSNAASMPASGPAQIFLFDRIASSPAELQRSKQYIASYFRTMRAGTTVAIFNLSPTKGLRLLQGFTTDGSIAAAAVENLDVEWSPDPGAGLPDAIAAAHQIAAYAAGVHGRKNLVWILQGTPPMIVHDGGFATPCRFGPPDMTVVHRLMDLYDIFTREQIAIYALNPGGVHGLGCNTLRNIEIAKDTGSGELINSNDFRGSIAKIVDDTTHSYTLSYVPTRPTEDGHFHPVKIQVNRPGMHLTYRAGYIDEQPNPPDAVVKAQMTQGPMRLGAMPATQIVFQMHVQAAGAAPSPAHVGLIPASTELATPHTKGSPYDVVFQLDPTQLAYIDAPDGKRTCSLEFDLGAYDAYSQLVTARSQTMKITVTPAQYEVFTRKPFNFTLPIDLPHGQLNLRAGVFDTSANKAGTLEVPFNVAKPAKN